MRLSRRAVGVALVASSLARGSSVERPQTFVLVPGAWHGAWCWKPVEERLRARGHHVLALTLTGVADRSSEATAEVGLLTHVDDVVRALGQLERVVLVGHSYAGMVITGAAAQAPRQISELVYLDAFVPVSGQSMFDLMKPTYVESWRAKAKSAGDGWRVPPMLSAKAMGVDDKTVDAKLTPQPLRTFEEKLTFDDAVLKRMQRRYVRCAKYGGFGPTAERVRALGWPVRSIDSGHDAMLAAPDALVSALL